MTRLRDAGSDWPTAGLPSGGGDRAILVIAEEVQAAATQDMVLAAGARLLGRVDWRDAPLRMERQGAATVVLANARGASDAVIAPVLPLLEALARSGDARIVVTIEVAQIDLFAATLGAPDITLLCAPAPSEEVAALCLAAVPGGSAVQEAGSDGEATRLRRLNEEVARIAETLARLTRAELDPRMSARGGGMGGTIGGAVGDTSLSYRAGPVAGDAPEVSARDIREAIRGRRLRDQYFGPGLFEDPAWDMLLDLFAAELERAQVSVSSLCIAAAVAPTTALRWISRMTEAGLFERQPDPFDRRRAFMGLSERASSGMRSYLVAVRRVGAVIA